MADRDYIGSAHNNGPTNGVLENGGTGDRGAAYSARYNNSNDSHRTGTYNPTYVHEDINSSEAALRRVRTAGSVTMSPELFEKLYLSPKTPASGDLRTKFANPTPIAIVGFLLSLTPLSADLMGWRGAGGDGAAGVGFYYWFGGLLMFTGGVLEWILGNTFSATVYTSYGAFWFALGTTLTPAFNAYGAYATKDPTQPWKGLQNSTYDASFGFFMLFMALLSLVYLICALRTNVIYCVIFATLVMVFGFLSGYHWIRAIDQIDVALKLEKAAGASGFISVLSGWYIFLSQMLASVDFPIVIPVGDLSNMIKGASARKQEDPYQA